MFIVINIAENTCNIAENTCISYNKYVYNNKL